MDIRQQIVTELSLQDFQVANTIALFDEGATVPFIARYRKERTGNLDEIQIRDIQHKYEYYKELEERKGVIVESIQTQGKLTPELEKRIRETLSKTELEDLYLPFKPKRTTRATKARDAGLEPLARWIVDLQDDAVELTIEGAKFLNPEKEVDTAQKALQGACDILAEELSEDADNRKWLRDLSMTKGTMSSSVKKEFEGKKTKFDMYTSFSEVVKTLPSHRILAMLRGEKEKVLRVALEIPQDEAIHYLESRLVKYPQSAAAAMLRETVKDSLERLLMIATETEVRNEVRERAEEEAIAVFAENVKTLLLAPPAGQKPVMGVDPGFRTGCKVVVLDATGKFTEYQSIFPHEPQNKTDAAARTIVDLVTRHGVALIAIGNGTASRETDIFLRSALTAIPQESRPLSVVVSESGASVYSASELAGKEFPDQDVTVRGAISIGRRLQDPLSELVKVDPKAIGVGQYQHDVNQKKLKDRLEEVVESCVNNVGVDLNLASEELLKHVAGLNRNVARSIVTYRNEHGAFPSRDALMQVPGMGAKTFVQAAGFLRIIGSDNPLDNSAVHPERYEFVQKLTVQLKSTIAQLIGNGALLKTVDKQSLVNEDIGLPTIEDIFAELEKPGRDPRATFTYATFSDTVREIADLKPGLELEGNVTNVANFGAFVDIGVHQDGLVHISQLADKFVSDPRTVVKVGQIVKVRVLEVDAERKRISLTMKRDPAQSPAPQQSDRGQDGRGKRENNRPDNRHDSRPLRGDNRGSGSQNQPPRSTPPPVRHATLQDLIRKHEKDDSVKLKVVKAKFRVK